MIVVGEWGISVNVSTSATSDAASTEETASLAGSTDSAGSLQGITDRSD